MDVVVTVPQAQWQAWLGEGDLAGSGPARHRSHFWIAAQGLPAITPGERVYIIAHNRLRGYAPLVGVEQRCTLRRGAACLMREGGAAAVTIPVYVRGFQGWRYRWWDCADEEPFPDWQNPAAPLLDRDAPPYVPGAPCHRCNRTVPVDQQDHEPVRVLHVGWFGHQGLARRPAAWVTQQRTVCRAGDPEGCRPG